MENRAPGKRITPGKENYLKVLFELSGSGEVRSSDVADALGISRASVSRMMKRLGDEGFIAKEKYGSITLTEKGRREAISLIRRYDLIMSFFIRVLGIDAETAAADACRIEHIISPESVSKIGECLNASPKS